MDNENNAIENKKNEKNNTTEQSTEINVGGFLFNLISLIIHLIIWLWIIGPIILYICKLSGVGVLPHDLHEIPFTNLFKESTNNNKVIDVNIIRESKKIFSTKVNLNHQEILEKFKNGIIAYLKEYQSNPKKANFFGNYWADIIFSIMSTNFEIFNNALGSINNNIAESIILIFSPLILLILLIVLYISNAVLTFVYQIAKIKEFFAEMKIENNKVVWEEGQYLHPLRWFFGFLSLFIFWPAVFILPMFTTAYALFSPLFVKGSLDNKKEYSFYNYIVDNIYYKSQIFLILFSILILNPLNSNLGPYYLVAFLISVAILALKHYYNFKPVGDDNHVSEGLAYKPQGMKGGYFKKSKKKGNKKH